MQFESVCRSILIEQLVEHELSKCSNYEIYAICNELMQVKFQDYSNEKLIEFARWQGINVDGIKLTP